MNPYSYLLSNNHSAYFLRKFAPITPGESIEVRNFSIGLIKLKWLINSNCLEQIYVRSMRNGYPKWEYRADPGTHLGRPI